MCTESYYANFKVNVTQNCYYIEALRKLKSLLVVGGENVAQFLRNTNIQFNI